jgi:glutamate racemase
MTKKGKIGVIGTEATIRSGTYLRAIKGFNPRFEVYLKACPLFVPLVEEGWTDEDNEVSLMVAESYLKELKGKEIDTLVLGCTHYPLLKGVLKKVMGYETNLIDSAQETAKEVKRVLTKKKLLNTDERTGKLRYFVTDDPERFKRMGYKFLGMELHEVKKIETIK